MAIPGAQPPLVRDRQLRGQPVGTRTILLNTEFSGPQIRDVAEREGAKVVIYDDDRNSEAVKLAEPRWANCGPSSANPGRRRTVGQHRRDTRLIARSSTAPAPKATKRSSIIILTSGTTGTRRAPTGTPRPPWRPLAECCPRAVQGAGGDVPAVADVPRAGLSARHHRDDDGLDAGAAPQVQTGHGPRRHPKHKVTALVVVPVMLSRCSTPWRRWTPNRTCHR